MKTGIENGRVGDLPRVFCELEDQCNGQITQSDEE